MFLTEIKKYYQFDKKGILKLAKYYLAEMLELSIYLLGIIIKILNDYHL